MNMEGQAGSEGFPMEGDTLPSFQAEAAETQDRLIEAMITCWRHPDRERAWQRVRSAWPDALYEAHEHGAGGLEGEVALRSAKATRQDVAEMEEAFAWVDALTADDRKLVGIVIGMLAQGRRTIPWRHLLRRMGLTRGVDGLRMRYTRAIGTLTVVRNGGNTRGCRVK